LIQNFGFPNLLSCVSVSLWLMFVCLAVPVWADQPKKALSVTDVTDKVEEAQSAIQDVQMDLSMEMKDTLSGTEQKSKGTVKIKSPNKVLVHYTQPSEQFLYMVGPLAEMYQPDQKMVYQQHKEKGDTSGPVYLGVGKELKRYVAISRVSIIKDDNDEVGLLFMPTVDNAGFDKMRVYIHKKDWWPYQMEVTTPSMVTKARFSNFTYNKGLKDDLFEFKIPKGTEIVEGAIF